MTRFPSNGILHRAEVRTFTRREFENPGFFDFDCNLFSTFVFRCIFFRARISNSHSSSREGFVSGKQPAGLLCTASQTDYCKVVSPNSHSSSREGFVSGKQPAGLLCTASQTDYCKVVSPRLTTPTGRRARACQTLATGFNPIFHPPRPKPSAPRASRQPS